MSNTVHNKFANDANVLVSLTTYKPRIQSDAFLKSISSILNQKFNGKIAISLTLFKEDEQYLSSKQKRFLQDHRIEIFISPINLRPHLKYFFAMQRYKDLPIITVDDDCVYNENVVQCLYDSYLKNGDGLVYSCRTHLMTYSDDGIPLSYNKWKHDYKTKHPSSDLMATGVGGVLYPPNCLKISPSLINDIYQKSLTTDDLYLKKRENDLGIKVMHVDINNSYAPLKNEYARSYALCCSDNIANNNINIIKLGLRKMNNKEQINMTDIAVIYRICDKPGAVHGNREFGSKDEAIRKCFPTFCRALSKLSEEAKVFTYRLLIVEDNIREDTRNFLSSTMIHYKVSGRIIPSSQPGNIGSFKTCFIEALKMRDDQFIIFIEDDYLCDMNSFRELILFYKMFNPQKNMIFLNPTTDTGSLTNIPVANGKYMSSSILPSSKSGLGIWWRQTFHTTSTFASNGKTLKKYAYVFNEILKQKELNERIRNRIFRVCPCFQPLYPLFQHYQRKKTMYWFSKYNDLPDAIYYDCGIACFNPQAKVDVVYR